MNLKFSILSLALIALVSSTAMAEEKDHWGDLHWVERASRALRGGDGLSNDENAEELSKKGHREIVREFVNDKRFADTVLDFNLYFLGYRQDRIRQEDGTYPDGIYESPQAIKSAQSVLNTKIDYMSLFDIEMPYYLGPLVRPRNTEADDQKLDDVTLRHAQEARILANFDDLIKMATMAPDDTTKICAGFNNFTNRYIYSNLLRENLTLVFVTHGDYKWYGRVYYQCSGAKPPDDTLLKALQDSRDFEKRLIDKLEELAPENYKISDVTSIRAIDLSDFNLFEKHTIFTRRLSDDLKNSSTNFDRKRAAYILRRFFCDDLTPIDIETPIAHAGGAHATDKACVSCHYKLDPMAGFFRDLGFRFRSFAGQKNIVFDDQASLNLTEYEKNWQPGPDKEHPWNVGYIRSSTKSELNSYGNSLEDLYTLLKTAPEVKRCLMTRLFSYFNTEDQTVDGDYIDFLSENFTRDLSQSGSSTALKNAASSIVMSKSFAQENRDSSDCYDYRPGHAQTNAAPCRVASILNKSCVKCHSSVDKEPYLDMKSWQKQSDGFFGFNHFDKNGLPISAKDTFKDMYERLSSDDPDDRMPKKSTMPDSDRAALYKWVGTQLDIQK